MMENSTNTAASLSMIDQREQSDVHADVISEQEYSLLLQLVLSHVFRLQSTAASTLGNNKTTKLEIQTREEALSSNIKQIVEDCNTCFSSTSQIQTRLSEATEAGLQHISSDLQRARLTLTERQNGLKSVMVELSRIGRQLSMLAMNAKIEASRADKSENGFSVVADEVKRLAKAAIQHHSEAAKMFDLTDVNDLIVKSVESFQQTHTNTETEIQSAFVDVNAAIRHVNDSANEMSEHHGIVSEVTQANILAVESAHNKIARAADRTNSKSSIVVESSPTRRNDSLKKLLQRDAIRHEQSFDRLQAIKSSGIIRIAIEPDFVGLSFRQNDASELTGLEVDYAKALANT